MQTGILLHYREGGSGLRYISRPDPSTWINLMPSSDEGLLNFQADTDSAAHRLVSSRANSLWPERNMTSIETSIPLCAAAFHALC